MYKSAMEEKKKEIFLQREDYSCVLYTWVIRIEISIVFGLRNLNLQQQDQIELSKQTLLKHECYKCCTAAELI